MKILTQHTIARLDDVEYFCTVLRNALKADRVKGESLSMNQDKLRTSLERVLAYTRKVAEEQPKKIR